MSPLKRLVLSVFVTQVLFFLISVSADKSPTVEQVSPASNSSLISKNESNVTNLTKGQTIYVEGGGLANISLQSSKVDDKNVTSNLTGREHEVIVNSSNQTVNVSTSPSRTIPAVEETPETELQINASSITHSTISARKSANSSESKNKGKDDHNVTVSVSSTIAPPVKKPTVTIPGEVDPSESVLNLNASVKTEVPSNVLDSRSQESTQKYVVPIVIVILSVPFVAIIISIMYKRGAEWWRYRHYRRMDFLINGMYDN